MFFKQPKTLITIPEAINAGKWRVLYAPFIFLFIALRVAQVMGKNQSGFEVFLSFLGLIAIAVLYWSIAVGRWRVWAFSNVSDIHWLFERANVEYILPTDNFFKKLEFKTDAQRTFWNEINVQLEKEKTAKSPIEDYDLPPETRIFDSKWQFWWIPLVSIVVLGGIYFNIKYLIFSIEDKNSKALLFLTSVMILVVAKEWWRGVKMLFSTLEPQIILTNEGIETPEFGQKKWSEINKIEVHTGGYGDDRKDELQLFCLTGEVSFTFFNKEAYEAYIENDDYEEDLEFDFSGIEDFLEDIDEATYEAHKNDDRYEKYAHAESFTKNVQELTVNPAKLEYLIKVYQSRGNSKRRINISK